MTVKNCARNTGRQAANFREIQRISRFADTLTKEHHAVMDLRDYMYGQWWSKADNQEYSPYTLCELT